MMAACVRPGMIYWGAKGTKVQFLPSWAHVELFHQLYSSVGAGRSPEDNFQADSGLNLAISFFF